MIEILNDASSLDSNTFQQELCRVRGAYLSGEHVGYRCVTGEMGSRAQCQFLLTAGPLPSGSHPGLVGKSYLPSNLNPFC